MKIDVFSHSFMVTELSKTEERAVENFVLRNLVERKLQIVEGRREMVADKTWMASNATNDYLRFHINMANEFLQAMAYHQIPKSNIRVTRYQPVIDDRFRIELEVKKLWDPREHQDKIIEHVLAPGYNKIVNLQAGGGKTEIAKHCMAIQQLRTVGFMKSSFIERWMPDMGDSFHFKPKELLQVAGSGALNSIMEMALEGESIGKCIFISINTFSDYIKSFENYGVNSMYPIAPIEFFHKLGIGFTVLDEGHQFLHQVMKLFAYTHVHKFLTLSGTLDTQNPFTNRMLETIYPKADRFTAGYWNKYIVVTSARYSLKKPNSIRCSGYQGAYSHTTFEASLMLAKNKNMLMSYLDLIHFYVDLKFGSVMEKGQKCLVFCATVKFCVIVQKYLQKKYPHLTISKYTSGDKAATLQNSDIVVSTVLSAGTAVDIPNLRLGLMTIALDSQQSNEQAMHRTRPLKDWPSVDAEFVYFACLGIDKHMKYCFNKHNFFKGKVKKHLIDMAPISV